MAVGAAADAAISRILRDVLALPDITEAESHRLSELCRIMNALEGLFVEDPTQVWRPVLNLPIGLTMNRYVAILRCVVSPIMAQVLIPVRAHGASSVPTDPDAMYLNFPPSL